MRRVTRLVALGAAATVGIGVLSAPASARAANSEPTRLAYFDTCHDAGSLDLRRIEITDDPQSATYSFRLTACEPLDEADFGANGSLVVPLSVPGGRDGFDYALVVDVADGGGLQRTLYRTPSDDPSTWVLVGKPVPVSPVDRDLFVAVSHAAIGSPNEFVFRVLGTDENGREDLLPERYAPALDFPFSCTTPGARASVVVEPGQRDDVVKAAKARGAKVSEAEGRVLTLENVSDLEAIESLPGVVTAERPAVYRKQAVPNDPRYLDQWSLRTIGAPQAWDVRRGSGLLLAVIDDGVDGLRPELAGRVRPGRDTLYDVELAADSDLGGHGTAVAGLAAAATDNLAGVAAVDWDGEVLPYRVFDAAGCAEDAAVAEALYLAQEAGASVANLSLGGPTDSEVLRTAIREVTQAGMLVVAAAGNTRTNGNARTYPAAYDEVIAVSATTRDGQIAHYSSSGTHIDIAAPGGDGSGTAGGDLLVLGPNDTIITEAGTSFATPLVSASAMLFRAEHPGLNPIGVTRALKRTALDAGLPGSDPDFGAGILDLNRLMRLPVAEPRDISDACPPGQVPEDGLADVNGSAHEIAVDCVVWWRVAEGRAGGYAPTQNVTRAQMATFLARLITRSGGSLPASPPDAFGDDNGSVHEHAINQLAAVGVLAGKNGQVLPDSPVTRAQMASFLVRAYELRTGVPLPDGADYFPDDGDSVHEQSINRAAAAGFTGGLPDGTYGTQGLVRRDAMASFLARVLDRLVEDEAATPPGA